MTKLFERFRAPTPIAWFFFILGFGTTIALGTWQVQRLEWKKSVIAQINSAKENAPGNELPETVAELKTMQFYPVRVRGTWMGETEFHIAPRYLHDQFGYAVVTPLKLTDGRIVLINRGWVPGPKKELSTRPESKVKGKATITGLVRVGDERSFFTPVSQPDKNIWFGRDIADMAAYAKLKDVIPAMIDEVAPTGPVKPVKAADPSKKAEPSLPIPSDGTIRLRNDHMGYIVTWYGLAAGMLLVFLLYHRRK